MRNEIIKDEHLEYLDKLNEEGVKNVYETAEKAIKFFNLSLPEALIIFSYWQDSRGHNHKMF